MIRVMSIGATVSRHLTLVIVLGVFLLGGRFALSTHPYEHELGAPVADCELCEFAHVSGDGAAVDNRSDLDLPKVELANVHTGRLVVANRLGIPLPRAPPFLF